MNSSWLDQSGNRIKQTYIQGFLDICGNMIIRNSNLSVGGNVTISNNLTCGTSISPYYKYLFQTTDINSNYNIIQIIPTSNFFSNSELDISNNYGNLSFKNGIYKATSSSNSNNAYAAYNAFNGSITSYWQSNSNYNNNTYTGTNQTTYTYNNNITIISGEWIQIELPNDSKSFLLTSFSIYSDDGINAPNEFYLFGALSTTNTVWKLLYSNNTLISNPFSKNIPLQTYNILLSSSIDTLQPYLIFRLVIKSTFNNNSQQPVKINQLNLYGMPYYINSPSQSIYSNNLLLNYTTTSNYDLLDSSSSSSITTINVKAGLGNGCLYINNSNYLSLPTLDIINTTGLSIFFWIQINNNQSCIIYEFNSSTNNLLKLQYDNTNKQLVLSITISSTISSKPINQITDLLNGSWCHIGIIYLQSSVNVYVNGILFQTILNLNYI
jgi:hypothetical protein